MLPTINHLFSAAGLRLLTYQPLAHSPVGQVIVIAHRIVSYPSLSLFSSSDLDRVVLFSFPSMKCSSCSCLKCAPRPALTLTLSSSRLLQAFPGAVRKAGHDAQEHAEALREHRQLLRLRPALRQHGGLFRGSGQLPRPLHGECTPATHERSHT